MFSCVEDKWTTLRGPLVCVLCVLTFVITWHKLLVQITRHTSHNFNLHGVEIRNAIYSNFN